MKRPIAILLGLTLLASADAVLARDGNRGGGHGGSAGHRGGGFVAGAHVGHHGGHHGGRPSVGVRPIIGVGPVLVIVGRPHPHRRPVVISSTIVVAAPFFYYPPAYAAPVYPVPVYQEPAVYIEQGLEVRYYCPDYRDYYPAAATCPSPWMRVLPGASGYPN
jgi:hypothetical protein